MYWTLKAVAKKKALLESRESDVLRDPPLAAAATSLSLLRLKQEKKILVSIGKKKRLANCVSFESTILLHELLSVSLHNSRDRIVVNTLRCGRSNPGSNPGHGNA